MVQFDSFNLPQSILRALTDMGFETPSPVQEAAIPLLLEGRDVIAQAQTGTGKTAAFGVPLVVAATEGRASLVLVPTRELAQQVAAEIDRIGAHAGVKAVALYGGASIGAQARALDRSDAAIVVATPGRLADHIQRGTYDPSTVSLAVLDEADEMLKMGFVEEVEAVLDAVGPERQTLLFSATMPDAVRRLASRHMQNPEHVSVKAKGDSLANANTAQYAVAAERPEKTDALVRILAVEDPTGVLVFRHTRVGVDELVQELRGKGLQADALHGGMGQDLREAVLARLGRGRGRVLVATNVAARGLDIDSVSHVVNYDVPREAEAYVHRIGRTGRAGREGRSFIISAGNERRRVRRIERTLNQRVQWRDVPTDDEVRHAVRDRTVDWLGKRAGEAEAAYLDLVDAALADGADARTLAAALLGRLATHEGIGMPRLDAAPARRAPPRDFEARQDRERYEGPMAPLSLNAGKRDGVRPADIVGALANEGGLSGGEVGRIDILPSMTVAEIPVHRVDDVLAAIKGVTIRGRPVQSRIAEGWQFRGPGQRPRPVRR